MITATIRTTLAASFFSATLITGAGTIGIAPAQAYGPCLFGHVDPNDDNSACRGSDSAQWPQAPAHPGGEPKITCGPENDGQKIMTRDVEGGKRLWICQKTNNLFGEDEWEWLEVALMGG